MSDKLRCRCLVRGDRRQTEFSDSVANTQFNMPDSGDGFIRSRMVGGSGVEKPRYRIPPGSRSFVAYPCKHNPGHGLRRRVRIIRRCDRFAANAL